ncbi:hypothetical protein DCAR_0830879 [Daucus carota subsp. sativus]|uniref:Uncharacterized protein n=1 Tax=Daucus carota subsp. sativus TaxID=79200 RepID=A0A175YKA0_DAUCS|nr:hypothetical protein DCAR_0830879 [Daucus carota subsp. sativus]
MGFLLDTEVVYPYLFFTFLTTQWILHLVFPFYLCLQDFHVHAFFISEAWESLDISVVEGNMYIIENFITRRAIGYLRPMTSDICIILNESSTVAPVPLELGRIPSHKFEITELGDIYSIVRNLAPDQDPTYALDIVGVILDLGDVKVDVSDSGTRVYVCFNLYDGRNMIKVVCCHEKIALIHPIIYGEFQTDPVVILSSMKPQFYKGILQVSSTSASKAYANIGYSAVRQIWRRLLDQL